MNLPGCHRAGIESQSPNTSNRFVLAKPAKELTLIRPLPELLQIPLIRLGQEEHPFPLDPSRPRRPDQVHPPIRRHLGRLDRSVRGLDADDHILGSGRSEARGGGVEVLRSDGVEENVEGLGGRGGGGVGVVRVEGGELGGEGRGGVVDGLFREERRKQGEWAEEEGGTGKRGEERTSSAPSFLQSSAEWPEHETTT